MSSPSILSDQPSSVAFSGYNEDDDLKKPSNLSISPKNDGAAERSNSGTGTSTKKSVISADGSYALSEAVARVSVLYPHMQATTEWKEVILMGIRTLGVIYGDIGTSPLYVWTAILANGTIDEASVLGAASLIIWSLISIVAIKYILLVMRIDNHGEGGIFALLAMLPNLSNAKRNFFAFISIMGACFLIGDGVITPAISVISALEGIQVGAPNLTRPTIVGVSCVVMVIIFVLQSIGTHRIGVTFGPIMLLFFIMIAIWGILGIATYPSIFRAFSPSYGLTFLFNNDNGGFLILGSIVLCVTGAEALYADLGHFGRRPIYLSWSVVVFPCLVLNYLGQGALLLADPSNISNPFYLLIPSGALWPMLVLSTLATVIASQALISGVFSLLNQAVSFSFFPTLNVVHTSSHMMGQVYIPEINYLLMVLCLIVVVSFQASAALTPAYGVAVTGVFVLTSIMYVGVLYLTKKSAMWKIVLYSVVFFTIDLCFFGTNLVKIPTGGYLPIAIGTVFVVVMWVWKTGREATEDYYQSIAMKFSTLKKMLSRHNVTRVKTVGVYLSSQFDVVPTALSILLPRISALPSMSIFLTVKYMPVPYVSESDRITIEPVPDIDGMLQVLVLYGFAETPNVKAIMHNLLDENLQVRGSSMVREADEDPILPESGSGSGSTAINIPSITFYISRERVQYDSQRWFGHRVWVALYDVLRRNARNKADAFQISPQETVEVGVVAVI